MPLQILFIGSFTISSARFSKFDAAGNAILFQIKVFARNIKETALGRYFMKVTAPQFYAIKSHKANKQSSLNMKIDLRINSECGKIRTRKNIRIWTLFKQCCHCCLQCAHNSFDVLKQLKKVSLLPVSIQVKY